MDFIKNIKLSVVMFLVVPCIMSVSLWANYTQNSYYQELSSAEKLDSAIFECDIVKIKYLLTIVDVNSKDDRGYSVLKNAIVDGKLEIIQLLVESGADVNALDDEGFSAIEGILPNLIEGIGMCYADGMEFAIEQGYFEEYILIAQYLIESGADVTLKHNLLDDFDGLDDLDLIEFMNNLSDYEKQAFLKLKKSMTILEIVDNAKNDFLYLLNSDDCKDYKNQEILQTLLRYVNKYQAVLEQAVK